MAGISHNFEFPQVDLIAGSSVVSVFRGTPVEENLLY